MTSGNILRALTVLAALAALGACDTVKRLTEPADAPSQTSDLDVKRPPLTLPPDFNLRPPAASGVGATDITASQQARQTVFGLNQEKGPEASIQRKAGRSLGESALLQHAGASAVNPDVRVKVDRESDTLARQEQSFVNNLMKPDDGQGGDAQTADKKSDGGWLSSIFGVDKNKKKPTIERKESGGLLGNLF